MKKKKVQAKKGNKEQKQTGKPDKNKLNWLLAVIVITLISYIPTLQNEFTTWDDDKYVTENSQIKDISKENIKFFFTDYYYGIYHPITMVSLMLDYEFRELDPTLYHLISLIIHLINTALLFFLIYMLLNNLEIAIITALLFGVHTIHVESVAWISARKDVLYSLLYLSSLIAYVSYVKRLQFTESKTLREKIKESAPFIKSDGLKLYLFSLLLFLLSLLAKGMAVSLTLSIIAIDYLLKRNMLKVKVILEKIPFLALSILFGIIAVHAPQSTGGLTNPIDYTFFEEIKLASFAFVQYIFKLIVPLNLSAFYPYPKDLNGIFLLNLIGVTGYLILIFYNLKRNRFIAFGLIFFLINIFLILRSISVVSYIIADRYPYIASIGIFLIIGFIYPSIMQKKPKLKVVINGILISYIVLLGYLTFERTKVWENDFTLFDDLIIKYPTVNIGWHNRANAREGLKDYKGALADYNMAIKINGTYQTYGSRANVKKELQDYKGAIKDADMAIKLKPDFINTYYIRGFAKEKLGDYEGAIKDSDTALIMNPNFCEVYATRGVAKAKSGDLTGAIDDFTMVIKIKPDFEAYSNRGSAKGMLNDMEGAIKDFTQAIKLKSDFAQAYFNRAMAEINLKQMDAACSDLQTATMYGSEIAKNARQKYCK